LQHHGIKFAEINISDNFGNLRQMRRLTKSRRVPVIAWNEQVVVGFDPAALKLLLLEEKLSE